MDRVFIVNVTLGDVCSEPELRERLEQELNCLCDRLEKKRQDSNGFVGYRVREVLDID